VRLCPIVLPEDPAQAMDVRALRMDRFGPLPLANIAIFSVSISWPRPIPSFLDASLLKSASASSPAGSKTECTCPPSLRLS
jgi:hypothetical protein